MSNEKLFRLSALLSRLGLTSVYLELVSLLSYDEDREVWTSERVERKEGIWTLVKLLFN